MAVDILAIGPHPDDIEIYCGGTVASLVKQGYNVALADITRGEMGTRGTKETRVKEAEKAAKILGVSSTRYNLEIPDGGIEVNTVNIGKVISLIRDLKPKTLLIPYSVERHPDHEHTHRLCKEAWFYSGLTKFETKKNGKTQAPHRPDNYFEYIQWRHIQPTFIVDISETFATKMESIRAYASQLYNPKSKEPETRLTSPEFLDRIETEDKYFGQRIGVKYGESFYSVVPVGVRSPLELITNKK